MTLEALGYTKELEKLRIDNHLSGFGVARVMAEHKYRYIISIGSDELEAEITGNLRFAAQSRINFPAVGDWVAITVFDDNSAVIHKTFPRLSVLSRKAVGQVGEVQIIAANVDYALLIQSANRDFSINRLERYLTLCYSSGIHPIIVLTKIDLISKESLAETQASIQQRIKDVMLIALSSESMEGYESLKANLQKGKTYCMLGSSGVGKSTLLNKLAEKDLMRTDSISTSSNRGKHVTTHRELMVLTNGAILIDNPGMREIGMTDSAKGLEVAFEEIVSLAGKCKYADCTHTTEKGCKITEALEEGRLERKSYKNFLKMEREKVHFESTMEERRRKDKGFGKYIKNYKKDMKRNGF